MINFLTALRKLYSRRNRYKKRTGKRLLPREEFEKRLKICEVCEHFTGKGCKQCGCCINQKHTLFNKVAFPTEKCPLVPPKWDTIS